MGLGDWRLRHLIYLFSVRHQDLPQPNLVVINDYVRLSNRVSTKCVRSSVVMQQPQSYADATLYLVMRSPASCGAKNSPFSLARQSVHSDGDSQRTRSRAGSLVKSGNNPIGLSCFVVMAFASS